MPQRKRARRLSPVVLLVGLLTLISTGRAVAGPAPDPSGTLPPVSAGASTPIPSAAPAPSHWEFRTTPYLWLSNASADVSADGEDVHASVCAIDVLRDLRFGFMNLFEARHDRFLLLVDTFYARLQIDESIGPIVRSFGPRTINQGPVQIDIPLVDVLIGPVKINTTSNTTFVDAKMGYRLLSRTLSGSGVPPNSLDRRDLVVDLLAGARYWYLRTTTEVEIPPIQVPGFNIQASIPAFEDIMLPSRPIFPGFMPPSIHVRGVTFGGLDRKSTVTSNWADPLLGMRVRVDLPKRFSVTALGDVGGFGIGSASQVTWQGIGLLGYRMSNRWTSLAGYRALGVNRDGVNLVLHGPMLGMSYRF